jgi:uncharacterized membrane protein
VATPDGDVVAIGPAESDGPPPIARTYDWAALASIGLIAGANLLVATDYRLPFLGPAVGFWFLVIHPVYLLYTSSFWGRSSVAERVGYSLTAVLLILMVAGLGINTVLPPLGVRRPLDPVPVLLLADALTVALYLLRRRFPARIEWRGQLRALKPEENHLLVVSGLCVALAVLGANRLNNDAGDQVSLAALVGIVVALVLLLAGQSRIREGITAAALYLLSLALLLMTSLRGWYVTGHDIQVEYHVFQLAESQGRWNIAVFRDAYNACLSITILPTEVGQIVHVDNPYVYKLFFQVIFAACPVLVYAISRRYWTRLIAVLAVVYFVGFPTFFTDMPYLNRQEIAFLFVCVAILAITNRDWSLRWRRIGLGVAALGIELSHYSTMYIFLGSLLAAWAAQFAALPIQGLAHRLRRRPPGQVEADRPPGQPVAGGTPWAAMARTVGIGSILLIAALSFLWGDLATQTAGSAFTTAESAISGLVRSSGARSSDVSYGLLPSKSASPQTLLRRDSRATFNVRATSSPGTYIPASVVARYPTPAINDPSLPLTGFGRLLSDIGIPVATVNNLVRQAAARGEQVFAIIGLIALVVARKFRGRVGREFFFLCVGSLAMVAAITVLPNLSVDYGLLRAFQESLILIAPVLVVGSLATFSLLRQWGPRVAVVICIGILVSTSGLLPQVLGGYPAQLNLNNSGQYYEVYYMHPQEVAAVTWLQGKPGVLPAGVQASYAPNRFSFTAQRYVSGQQSVTDIYPPLVQRSSWVIVGYSTLHTGEATTTYDGDLLTYAYPLGFLQSNKNLVYNNGGAEIYR